MNALLPILLLIAAATGARTAGAASVIPDDSTQLLLVTTTDWQAPGGRLQAFERVDGGWRAVRPAFTVSIGKHGSAWGLGLHPPQEGQQKREGDGKAPAGVFELGSAFGYAPANATGLGYQPMTESDWCVDVNDSPLYNRIVSTLEVGEAAVIGSSEPMRRDLHRDGDRVYAKGFVIAHNPNNTSGAGSCIFAHLWRAPGTPTAGCTAMPEAEMDALLAWLDQARNPVLVLLPESAYRRLQADWQLPERNP
ncbi:MAG: L,D-transpeptidase [Arenimonas sp.]